MVGRFGLTHHPVGRLHGRREFPARAVVGEHVPVVGRRCSARATTRSAPTWCARADGRKTAVHAHGAGHGRHRPLARHGRRRPRRACGRSPSRRGATRSATWHHAVTVKIDAGQGGEDLANDLETGARLFERLAKRCPRPSAPRGRGRRRRCATRTWTSRTGSPRPSTEYLQRLVHEHPVRELVTVLAALPAVGRPPARAVRRVVRVLPALDRRRAGRRPESRRPGRPARHVQGRHRAPRLRRRRWASTWSTCRRSTRSARSTARARTTPWPPQPWDVGSPWAIGSRRRRARRHPSRARARWPTSAPSSRRARELGMEVALDFALQAAPDHPWVTDAPGVVHHQARRHDRLRREPAEEVPGHLPDQLRQRPRGPLRRVPARARALDRRGRHDLPRRQPAHQADQLLAVADRRGQARPSRRAVPGRGVHPSRDDARAGQDRLHPELHLLHLAQHEGGDRGRTRSELVESAALHAAELLRQHPGHPARLPGARRPGGIRDPRRAGGDAVADLGRVLRLRAVRAPAAAPGSEEYLDSEKYQLRPRDFAAAIADGRSLAPFIAQLNRIRREHPALHRLRNLHFHEIDNDEITVLQQARRGHRRHGAGGRARNPHETREATVSWIWPRSASTGTTGFGVRDLLSGSRIRWGEHNYVRLDPHRPAHIFVMSSPIADRADLTRPTRPDSEDVVHAADVPSTGRSHRATADPDWFKRAVFYEVLVRGFSDSNGDGTGDLRGLADKLDYLQWLGVDCLWLPPFYPSPLRDGGYDVSDYSGVLPEFGTIEDFKALPRRGARPRGIRVIIDFVMNHTSDAAPVVPGLAQRSRRPLRRLLRLERRRHAATPTRGSSSSTPSRRTGRSTRSASSTSGTASSATSPTSTSTPRPCSRRSSTRCGSGSTSASTASASTRCPICTSATAPTARTCPRRTSSCGGCARRSTATTPTACCCARRTSGRPTSSSTSAIRRSAATSATWRSTSR